MSHSYTDQCVPAHTWLPLDREGHLISRQSPRPTVKSATLPSLQDPNNRKRAEPCPSEFLLIPPGCTLGLPWWQGALLCSCLHDHRSLHWEGSGDDNQYGNRGISQAQVTAQHGRELHHRAKRYTCTSQTRKSRCFKFQDWEMQRGNTSALTASVWQPRKLHETFMSRSGAQAPPGGVLTQRSRGSELNQIQHWNIS